MKYNPRAISRLRKNTVCVKRPSKNRKTKNRINVGRGINSGKITAPMRWGVPLQNKANCGPIVLYMLNIITLKEYDSIIKNTKIWNPYHGTLPHNMQEIVQSKEGECSWLQIMTHDNNFTEVASLNEDIIAHLQIMSRQTSQTTYATIILFYCIKSGQFIDGHYCVLLYENGKSYIIDPFNYETSFVNMLTCNHAHKKIPFSKYLETRTGYNNILILQEGDDIHNIYQTSTNQIRNISDKEILVIESIMTKNTFGQVVESYDGKPDDTSDEKYAELRKINATVTKQPILVNDIELSFDAEDELSANEIGLLNAGYTINEIRKMRSNQSSWVTRRK